jgi:hypothetical protein
LFPKGKAARNPASRKTKERKMETTNQANNQGQNEDYPQWVIVENLGEDNEDIWADYDTQKEALDEMNKIGGKLYGFELTKRLSDGTLTTEF